MRTPELMQRALDRIVRATSVIRTRREDAERDKRHGPPGVLTRRIEATAASFDRLARGIERRL